jgi:hypothetical protein
MPRGTALRSAFSDGAIPRAQAALAGHNCLTAIRPLRLCTLGVNADALMGMEVLPFSDVALLQTRALS